MVKNHLLIPLLLLAAGGSSMVMAQAMEGELPGASESTAEMRGEAFAQAHCAQCHSIEAGFSPRPESPSFAHIVNTEGLTDETLNYWLAHSHNFPAMMDFEIAPEQIDDLAQYMLTLRDESYQPPVQ
jgi:mono/diheme cytochrome c family protein